VTTLRSVAAIFQWEREMALYLPEKVAHPPWQKRKIQKVDWETRTNNEA
jgi:hypothetical protein